MKKFLVLYLAPVAVVDEWKKKPEAERKGEEEKMMGEWKQWMSAHAKDFADLGAGAGKTKRVTAQGAADARNDVMMYALVQAESHDAAAKLFVDHPHFQIPQASIEVMEINALPPA
ncbi:MAG: hypothetical protein ABJB04_01170 [Betaproteobacteria bacterium]